MKIYDISQEVFSCQVYPGNRCPRIYEDKRISRGDRNNLTSFEMCAHNGTHIDAPWHFLEDGCSVEQIPLDKFVGWCYVTAWDGMLDAEAARQILQAAGGVPRILLKGPAVVTPEAARVFADAGIFLLGVEGQSVGLGAGPMAVHKALLGADVVLLEGIRLDRVAGGVYFLNAAPLSLAGSDGAPCRAILIEGIL